MSIRSDILDQYGLPDGPAIAIERCIEPQQGLPRIKVSCDGMGDQLWSIGEAKKRAQRLRGVDDDLADRIEACLREV